MHEGTGLHERIVDNHGVAIHTLLSGDPDVPVPLVVVPGMTEPAERYAAIMAGHIEGRSIFLSIRGRGKSGAPARGYSFDDQISDIEAVVSELADGPVCLLGHSVGGALALGYALEHPGRVAGLIVSDYPPFYPRFGDTWVERTTVNHYSTVPEHAARRIAEESAYRDMTEELGTVQCPVLITHGGREGTLLRPEHIEAYRSRLPDCTIEILPESGHNPFLPHEGAFLEAVHRFVQRIRDLYGKFPR